MTIDLHIFDRGGAFGQERIDIRNAVQRGIDWALAQTVLKDIDVILYATDFGRDQTLSAVATNASTALIGVDTAMLALPDRDTRVTRCTVHELNHCHRWPHVPRWTVAEAVILEGLVQMADAELPGVPAHSDADPSLLPELAERVDDDMEDHRDWLYTSVDTDTTFRIYTAGLALIERATKRLELAVWDATTRPAIELLDAGLRG